MNRAPVVWVAAHGTFDYSPARVFAPEIRVIPGDKLSPNASADWHANQIQEIRRCLSDYIPGIDFVIPTGQPVRMMLVAMLLKERGDRHQFLGWDDKTQRYFHYPIDLRPVDHSYLNRV
jgi:hypothetical protein